MQWIMCYIINAYQSQADFVFLVYLLCVNNTLIFSDFSERKHSMRYYIINNDYLGKGLVALKKH